MKIAAAQLLASYDLIVVGAGPAGLTLARKYAALSAGTRVLIIESGPEAEPSSAAQALAEVDAAGDLDAAYYRFHSQRLLGGTSTIWAGLAAVLERRSFLNGDWPIAYDELYRFYPEAAEILQLPPEVHTRAETPLGDNGNIVSRPVHVSPPVRWGAGNRALMDWLSREPRVHILFEHTVTAVCIEQARATGVTARPTARPAAKPLSIDAGAVAVACGGIQNPRLLQLSLPDDHRLPVGRYFASHVHVEPDHFGRILLDRDAVQAASAGIPERVWPAFALSSEFCVANGLLSGAFICPWRSLPPGRLPLLGQRKDVIAYKCVMHADMPLALENRIDLSAAEKDALGQPRAAIRFKWPRKEVEDIHQAMAERLVKSGLGRLSPLPYPPFPDGTDIGADSGGWGIEHGGGHMLCSTRMGHSPATSVVDGDCRVHGLRGLYVAGSSVFAAAERANPTYTIVALALRLAQHLARHSAGDE